VALRFYVMAGLASRVYGPNNVVMAGHSRPKDGVLSHAYVPAIHVFTRCCAMKTWMPATSAGMTWKFNA
jgi:hypothetical protein